MTFCSLFSGRSLWIGAAVNVFGTALFNHHSFFMGWIRVYTSQTQKGDAGIWGNLSRTLQPPLESGLGLCFWSLGRLQGVSQSSRTSLPVLTYESFCPANTSVQVYDVLNKIPWLAWGSLPFLFKVCTLYSVHCTVLVCTLQNMLFWRQHDDSIVQSWFSVPVEWQGYRCTPPYPAVFTLLTCVGSVCVCGGSLFYGNWSLGSNSLPIISFLWFITKIAEYLLFKVISHVFKMQHQSKIKYEIKLETLLFSHLYTQDFCFFASREKWTEGK